MANLRHPINWHSESKNSMIFQWDPNEWDCPNWFPNSMGVSNNGHTDFLILKPSPSSWNQHPCGGGFTEGQLAGFSTVAFEHGPLVDDLHWFTDHVTIAWLVVGEKPPWKIWLRQLGWWNSQYFWENDPKISTKPPTSNSSVKHGRVGFLFGTSDFTMKRIRSPTLVGQPPWISCKGIKIQPHHAILTAKNSEKSWGQTSQCS